MKILLIEDDKWIIEGLKECINLILEVHKPTILIATSIEEARQHFELHQNDLKLITFDGSIKGGGEQPNTKCLVSDFRKTYFGPMIACSSLEENRDILVKAGCDYSCSKDQLPQYIMKIFSVV